jgi:hypothetical protein
VISLLAALRWLRSGANGITAPQQCLNFLPLPQEQGSFRPEASMSEMGSSPDYAILRRARGACVTSAQTEAAAGRAVAIVELLLWTA